MDENQVGNIIDKQVKEKVLARLQQYNYKPKEAFKDLMNQPIWFNEEKKITIKSARLATGLTAIEPIKKDALGREIGFVKPGNNHHIALYQNEDGKCVEHVCTFWHAVERKRYGFPVVIADTTAAWGQFEAGHNTLHPSFLSKLPPPGLQLLTSLQQNEAFLLGLESEAAKIAIQDQDYALLSNHLYIVQKISESDYWFRHHLETKNSELKTAPFAKEMKRYFRFKSSKAFWQENPIKVKVNYTGSLTLMDSL